MKINHKLASALRNRSSCKEWAVCGIVLVSFAAGSLLTARLMHLHQVRADSNRVFELNVYHTLPGKVPELESIFRDVSKLIAKHGLNVVGYWVPNDDPAWANTFVYLVAHPSREDAKKNWARSFMPTRRFQSMESWPPSSSRRRVKTTIRWTKCTCVRRTIRR